jgi:hypothetical protein
MLDDQTLQEAALVQDSLGASSASETVRYTIRKMARLMRVVSEGAEVKAIYPSAGRGKRPKTVVLDIPPARAA